MMEIESHCLMCDDIGAAKRHKKRLSLEEQPSKSEISVPSNLLETVARSLAEGTFFVHVTSFVSVTANGANFVTGRQCTFVACLQGSQRIFIK